MSTYFISDLHLDESRPAVTRAFLAYLEQWAGHCDGLYILGDFFEVWVGDDDDAELSLAVCRQLKHFSSKSPLHIMHGNRDFLLGESFCKNTGATLLTDPCIIDLYGKRTLLMHGDSLCTQDKEYMTFRQQARSKKWQQHLLSQPLAARRTLAAQLREQSQSMNSLKAEDIMDVSPEEVVATMQKYNCLRLIHGHTHRPARHKVSINHQPGERIVLGDWCDKAWILKAKAKQLQLQSFTL